MKIDDGLDAVVEEIKRIGMERSPLEACGVVIPSQHYPPAEWVIELENRAEHPEDAYDLRGHTVADLLLAREDWEEVTVWHTHPDGGVGPSKGDMKHRLPELSYLVVALPDGPAVRF